MTQSAASNVVPITPQPAVLRTGLCGCQVCVPADYTDAQVEQYTNGARPTGIRSQWTVCAAGDEALNGDIQRVPCAERSGYVHILLTC